MDTLTRSRWNIGNSAVLLPKYVGRNLEKRTREAMAGETLYFADFETSSWADFSKTTDRHSVMQIAISRLDSNGASLVLNRYYYPPPSEEIATECIGLTHLTASEIKAYRIRDRLEEEERHLNRAELAKCIAGISP